MTQPTRPGDPSATTGNPPSSAGQDQDAHVIDLATPEWCWSRLRGTTEGVLASGSEPRPARLLVGYTVDDGEVVIPIDDLPDTVHLLAGHVLSLGLTGRVDGLRWVVRATGVARLSLPLVDALMTSRRSHPAHGDRPARRTDALLLAVERLRGYYETPLST